MIRIGIAGYGNLGRGVEAAVKNSDDMELVAVFTRRDPESVKIRTDRRYRELRRQCNRPSENNSDDCREFQRH